MSALLYLRWANCLWFSYLSVPILLLASLLDELQFICLGLVNCSVWSNQVTKKGVTSGTQSKEWPDSTADSNIKSAHLGWWGLNTIFVASMLCRIYECISMVLWLLEFRMFWKVQSSGNSCSQSGWNPPKKPVSGPCTLTLSLNYWDLVKLFSRSRMNLKASVLVFVFRSVLSLNHLLMVCALHLALCLAACKAESRRLQEGQCWISLRWYHKRRLHLKIETHNNSKSK